mgnify:FL=1
MREFEQDIWHEEKMAASIPVSLFLGILVTMILVALTLPDVKEENKLYKACYNACKVKSGEEDIGASPSFLIANEAINNMGACIIACKEKEE